MKSALNKSASNIVTELGGTKLNFVLKNDKNMEKAGRQKHNWNVHRKKWSD